MYHSIENRNRKKWKALNILKQFDAFQNKEIVLKRSNPNCTQLIDEMNLSDDIPIILKKMLMNTKDISASIKIKNTIAFVDELKRT